MTSKPNIEWDKTAVLVMDYQNDIIGMQPEEKQKLLLNNATQILSESRKKGVPVIYIVVRFREGYPEISQRNKMFSFLNGSGRFIEGTKGSEVHSKLAPLQDEIVVTKRRVGAFSTTELETILRAKRISTLILLGNSTSGVVLSTVRCAADMDYSLFVISDACADQDDEVHRVLVEKIFPKQSAVITTQDFLNAMQTAQEKTPKNICNQQT
jgi:nicotinamidase-related amidase